MATWATLVVFTGIIVFAIRRRRSRRENATAPRATKNKAYQSVSIKWELAACDAAKQLDGQRFIGLQAPSFPLPDCDAEQCKCRYEFHGDRREGDRRMLHGMRHSLIVVNGSEDKRAQPERRLDG